LSVCGWRRSCDLHPSLIHIRRGGIIGDELTIGITGALNYGYVQHLDGRFV
jgi:hypothetical protein